MMANRVGQIWWLHCSEPLMVPSYILGLADNRSMNGKFSKYHIYRCVNLLSGKLFNAAESRWSSPERKYLVGDRIA
jgi:hypothetical protein